MKKLAIVGSGTLTRDNAPWDDMTYDIWVINESACQPWCKRWNGNFQLHIPEIYKQANHRYPGYWEWLQQDHGAPIYMQNVDPDVPNSVRYPIEDAIALSGETYLTSTIAEMIALAVLEGYEDVSFYGVELSSTEYQYQADCYRYWIGFLKGLLGPEHVHVESSRHLFTDKIYGFEGAIVFERENFAKRAAALDAEWTAANRHLEGMKRTVEIRVNAGKHAQLPETVAAYRAAAEKTGMAAGALSEAERYMAMGSPADRGTFESAAAQAQRTHEQKRLEMYTTLGKIEYVGNVFKQTGDQRAAKQLLQFLGELGKQAYDYGAMEGVYSENQAYIKVYDSAARASGMHFVDEVPEETKLAMGMVKA
ncbi:conserved hypothetical protein [Gammaproteobacteria bacterium]